MSEIKVNAQQIEIGRVCRATISTDDLIAALRGAPLDVRERVRDGAFAGFVLNGDYEREVERAEKAERECHDLRENLAAARKELRSLREVVDATADESTTDAVRAEIDRLTQERDHCVQTAVATAVEAMVAEHEVERGHWRENSAAADELLLNIRSILGATPDEMTSNAAKRVVGERDEARTKLAQCEHERDDEKRYRVRLNAEILRGHEILGGKPTDATMIDAARRVVRERDEARAEIEELRTVCARARAEREVERRSRDAWRRDAVEAEADVKRARRACRRMRERRDEIRRYQRMHWSWYQQVSHYHAENLRELDRLREVMKVERAMMENCGRENDGLRADLAAAIRRAENAEIERDDARDKLRRSEVFFAEQAGLLDVARGERDGARSKLVESVERAEKAEAAVERLTQERERDETRTNLSQCQQELKRSDADASRAWASRDALANALRWIDHLVGNEVQTAGATKAAVESVVKALDNTNAAFAKLHKEIRALVGDLDNEATVDAVKRVVEERDALWLRAESYESAAIDATKKLEHLQVMDRGHSNNADKALTERDEALRDVERLRDEVERLKKERDENKTALADYERTREYLIGLDEDTAPTLAEVVRRIVAERNGASAHVRWVEERRGDDRLEIDGLRASLKASLRDGATTPRSYPLAEGSHFSGDGKTLHERDGVTLGGDNGVLELWGPPGNEAHVLCYWADVLALADRAGLLP